MDRLPRARHVAEELLGVGPQGVSGRRNREASADAGEKLDAERIFQCAHARAYGGLADAQSRGRAMKAAVRDDGEESFDLVNFHCDDLRGTKSRSLAPLGTTIALLFPQAIKPCPDEHRGSHTGSEGPPWRSTCARHSRVLRVLHGIAGPG